MGVVTATVTIQFTGTDGQLSAEVDSRADGPNNGKTSFSPGDDVYLLVRKSADVTVVGYPSLGSVGKVGDVSGIKEKQVVTFPRTRSVELSQAPAGAVSLTWYGTSLGSYTVKGKTLTLTGAYNHDNPPVGVAMASYESAAESWKLSGLPSTVGGKSSYEVLVVLVGTTPD